MADNINMFRLHKKIRHWQTCIEWLQSEGLIPTTRKCPYCGEVLTYSTEDDVLGNFRCRRKHGKHGYFVQQVAKNTWFEGINVSPEQVMLLTYCFARNYSRENTIAEASIIPSKRLPDNIVGDFFSYCREVCVHSLERRYVDVGQIGGSDHIVEIDTWLLGKRKQTNVEGIWILGMLEHDSPELRLEICPDNNRSSRTLVPLIQKHVKTGSTIYTDKWEGYSDLESQGFTHVTFDHNLQFLNAGIGGNSSKLVPFWRALNQRLLHSGYCSDTLADHLGEFLWRQECKRREADPFQQMLCDIRVSFPGEQ